MNEVIPLCINFMYLIYHIFPSTQHTSLSRPHNKERKNYGHTKRFPYLQRDKSRQPDQWPTDGQGKCNIWNRNTRRPLQGARSSTATQQLKKLSCEKPFTPAGSESYAGTEAHPILHEASYHLSQKTVSNIILTYLRTQQSSELSRQT